MDLLEYQKAFKVTDRVMAEKAGTVPAYIYQIARNIKKPSLRMARKLIAASGGLVTLVDLRPDYAEELTEIEAMSTKNITL